MQQRDLCEEIIWRTRTTGFIFRKDFFSFAGRRFRFVPCDYHVIRVELLDDFDSDTCETEHATGRSAVRQAESRHRVIAAVKYAHPVD